MTALLEKPEGAVCAAPDHDAELAAAHALVIERLGSDPWKKIDALEAEMAALPQVDLPLHHVFTPGLYVREIFIPKGTIATTRIHLTEHPFVISAGVVSIWTDDLGCVTLRAPHTGVTKPGTRRVLFAHSDVIFSTFHVTDETDPDTIVRHLTFCGGKFNELRGAAA